MTVTLSPSYQLTTKHAASSYGQPVLVHRPTKRAFGSADIVQLYPSWSYQLASDAVKRLAKTCQLDESERELVDKFVERERPDCRQTPREIPR